MKIRNVHAVWFSPCTGTRKLVLHLAGQLAERLGVPLKKCDFTLPSARAKKYRFAANELVVFGTPTYAGKVPNKLRDFIAEGFTAKGAPAAALVSFGNRAFDNSLVELVALLAADGFTPLAGAAVVSRHAFSTVLASDRPNEEDFALLDGLAEKIVSVLDADELPQVPLAVPGDADAPYYKPVGLDGELTVFLKAKPVTDPALCDGCSVCAKRCPMGAISFDDFSEIPGTCIKCHACVRLCHAGAKSFDDPAFLSHKGMLERDQQQPKQSCAFCV